jgi:hypothetical protein
MTDGGRIQPKREPQIRRGAEDRGVEGAAQHADDPKRFAVDEQARADCALVAAETTLPESLAEDDDPIAVWTIVWRRKYAADRKRSAEEPEKVRRDLRG